MNKKILLALIPLLLVPMLLNLLFISEVGITVADNNDWIGFFGSYGGAILGGLVAVYVAFLQVEKQQELFFEKNKIDFKYHAENNRSYIYLRELHTVPMDLSGIKVKESSRILLTEAFGEFEKQHKLSEWRTTFFVITHHGNPNIIHNCKAVILCWDSEKEERYTIEQYIGSIEKSEEIYIPLFRWEGLRETYVLNAKISYHSINGEKLLYYYDVENNVEKYFIDCDEESEPILEFKMEPVTWVYPNKKK